MCEHRGQPNEPGLIVDRGGLHGRDLVLAQCLANDVEPTGERGITERPIGLPREWRSDGRRERFLGIDQFALGCAVAMAPIDSLERCIAGLHLKKIKADGP